MANIKKILIVVLIIITMVSVFVISFDAFTKRAGENSYVLKIDNEKIALFSGKEKLEEYSDIVFSTLPVVDRERLREGIEFTSIDDARRAVEDYDG